ncbi:MAG: DUF2095 family protein [Candidatus Lokiarchaeota archaeon]|nr:DUF2095 family protein [Candidatus Lokiarchaeota archaeon]
MNHQPEEYQKFKSIKIESKECINFTYDKDEIEKEIPHIINEIATNKDMIKIDSIKYNEEKTKKEENVGLYFEELTNPSALDFIRRCNTKKDAVEILDYLLRRKEISEKNYNLYKEEIEKENGLEILIEKNGGFKKSGYYLRKYYFKDKKNK